MTEFVIACVAVLLLAIVYGVVLSRSSRSEAMLSDPGRRISVRRRWLTTSQRERLSGVSR